MDKIKVGVLGATGMVGQMYLKLLVNHPWFDVSFVAASPRSAGKSYGDAVNGRWHMPIELPANYSKLMVYDANKVSDAIGKCRFVFSALEMDKESVRALEAEYAKQGIAVVSNASANRWVEDVPMLVPEINHDHVKLIAVQKRNRGYDKGFIAVKPNCSLQSYLTPIYALNKAGFEVSSIILTTLQAVSGGGYPGVSSMDMVDNIIPYIGGEEEKTENEPMKILGSFEENKIIPKEGLTISAHCNRVPVVDGHTACVSVKFKDKKPTIDEVKEIWSKFSSVPQELDLPMAPKRPIILMEENNRPQPRKDRDVDKGMAVSIGRIRECNVLDYRFVALSHNTIRGAAGGGILNAELLASKGFFK